MKSILRKILLKQSDAIAAAWTEKLKSIVEGKLTFMQARKFVKNSLSVFSEITVKLDYSQADQYFIEIYNLFSRAKLNLIEISQIYAQGRYALLGVVNSMNLKSEDTLILIRYVNEIIEQTFARYAMLHQEAEMKDVMRDRNRLAAKLESNKQYLSSILHYSDSAILIVDKNEKFIAWNLGAEKIFGYTEQEVLQKPSSLLIPDRQQQKDELSNIKKIVREKGFLKIPDTERRTKEGKIISVQLKVTCLTDEKGEYAGRSVIIKDITKEKILQKQIDQSEKLAVIGQIAAGIAHEIGNPLTSISAIVQILQRKTKDKFSKQQLADIKTNIDRISKIVRELVDFSRPPEHEHRLILINEVIRTALGIVRYDKRVKDIEFITDFDEDLPEILIVPDQLLQVFVNILLNAVDAVEGEGTIEIKTYRDKKFICTKIADNGCGMDKNTMDKIFDPFFSTKEVGKGTGLGLSVSYGIIKKFKGDITVESILNRGSTFIVLLPQTND